MASREDRNPEIPVGTSVFDTKKNRGYGTVVGRGVVGDPYIDVQWDGSDEIRTTPRWGVRIEERPATQRVTGFVVLEVDRYAEGMKTAGDWVYTRRIDAEDEVRLRTLKQPSKKLIVAEVAWEAQG